MSTLNLVRGLALVLTSFQLRHVAASVPPSCRKFTYTVLIAAAVTIPVPIDDANACPANVFSTLLL